MGAQSHVPASTVRSATRVRGSSRPLCVQPPPPTQPLPAWSCVGAAGASQQSQYLNSHNIPTAAIGRGAERTGDVGRCRAVERSLRGACCHLLRCTHARRTAGSTGAFPGRSRQRAAGYRRHTPPTAAPTQRATCHALMVHGRDRHRCQRRPARRHSAQCRPS